MTIKGLRLGLVTLAVARVAGGQTATEVAAYQALIRTPIEALATLPTNPMLGLFRNGTSIALRYAYVSGESVNNEFNNVAATAIVPIGFGSTLSLTAGVTDEVCTTCTPAAMFSIAGNTRLFSTAYGVAATAPELVVNVKAELGLAGGNPGSYSSAHIGLPISVVTTNRGFRVVPFLIPGIGFGRQSTGGTSMSDIRATFGGGLSAYVTGIRMNVDLGAEHVFINNGTTTVGIGAAFGS